MSLPLLAMAAITVAMLALPGACTGRGSGAIDSYEDYNRVVHRNNLKIDRYVLRPVAQGYRTATPTLVQHLLSNAFDHVDTVGDFVNYLLQGRRDPALRSLGRFTLNTLMGAGGLLDPATEFGLPREETDFGITLAGYGIEPGPYMVVTFIGPTTSRDLLGLTIDAALDPLMWIGFATGRPWLQPTAETADLVDFRADDMALIDDLLYESDDSYVTLRSVYLQRRRAQIAGDQAVIEDLPDIFDDPAD